MYSKTDDEKRYCKAIQAERNNKMKSAKRIIALTFAISMCFCTCLVYAGETQDAGPYMFAEGELNEVTPEETAEAESPVVAEISAEMNAENSINAEETQQEATDPEEISEIYFTEIDQGQDILPEEQEESDEPETGAIEEVWKQCDKRGGNTYC